MGYFKVITAPTSEPISLTEVKRHLRIYDDGYDDEVQVSITPSLRSAGNTTGTGVDVLGTSSQMVINVGAVVATGTLIVKLQESDDDITYTDWATFDTVTDTGGNEVYSKVYTGVKQYIRAYATVANADVTFSVVVSILAGDPQDDLELAHLITRAREYAEEKMNLALAPQTLGYAIDKFPQEYYAELPRPPLTSVSSFKIYDADGTETTLVENTDYLVDTDRHVGRVVLPYGGTWPANVFYPVNPIRFEYVAGYTELPQKLKSILLYHIGLLRKYKDMTIPDNEYAALNAMYNFYKVRWYPCTLED